MNNTQPNPTNNVPSSRTVIDDETLTSSDSTNTKIDQVNQKDGMKKVSMKVIVVASLVAIMSGSATGWGSYSLTSSSTTSEPTGSTIEQVAGDTINNGDIFGTTDTQTFSDTAQGYLQAGGLDGEGSHSLIRPGGVSQTVYLTSSVTDLDKLTGMEIKVWGETYRGQKAGWLMDVGKVEVINTQAESPEAL